MSHVMKMITLAVLFFAGSAFAEEHAAPAAGGQSAEQKAAACFACHGDKGAKPTTPQTPVLAGQYQDYIQNALKSYRETDKSKPGARKNAVMSGMAAGLSDGDIKILATYFAAQKSPLYTPKLEQ